MPLVARGALAKRPPLTGHLGNRTAGALRGIAVGTLARTGGLIIVSGAGCVPPAAPPTCQTWAGAFCCACAIPGVKASATAESNSRDLRIQCHHCGVERAISAPPDVRTCPTTPLASSSSASLRKRRFPRGKNARLPLAALFLFIFRRSGWGGLSGFGRICRFANDVG